MKEYVYAHSHLDNVNKSEPNLNDCSDVDGLTTSNFLLIKTKYHASLL